ncbi:hypothetical protein ACWIUH_07580 [Ursidibacter arcticus]
MQEKYLTTIERFKESSERASLNIALSEWAYEKLKNHEVLDENSLREWAISPKCSKGKSLALLNFLEEIKASTKTDK